MKKRLFIAIMLVVAVGATAAFVLKPGSGAQASAATSALAPVKAASGTVAQGRVLPSRYAELAMVQSGVIAQVLVAPGDDVKSGQPLIRLDSARPQAAVAQAQAELKGAEARLKRTQANPTDAELAAAQAQVAAAQAEYARLYAKTGKPSEAGSTSPELAAAKAAVEKSRVTVERAQAAYDRAGGASNPYIGMLPESVALQSALIDYQQAQAALAALNPTADDLKAAQSKLDQAKAQYAQLLQGPRVEDIRVAEAEVERAKAAIQVAEAAARDVELRAPFDGTIAWIDAKVGESLSGGAPVVRLAQLSSWQVQTEDLAETSLGQIQVGSAATLKFDAIPDLVLAGTVERIELVGEKKQGDMTYTVVVRPQQNDSRLRWNMTASVLIERAQ